MSVHGFGLFWVICAAGTHMKRVKFQRPVISTVALKVIISLDKEEYKKNVNSTSAELPGWLCSCGASRDQQRWLTLWIYRTGPVPTATAAGTVD